MANGNNDLRVPSREPVVRLSPSGANRRRPETRRVPGKAGHRLLHQIVVGGTDLGRTPSLVLVFAVCTVWLLLRRVPKLAIFVVLADAGGILNAVVKELVARLRSPVSMPRTTPSRVAAKPGRRYAVKATTWPAARSSG